MTQVT